MLIRFFWRNSNHQGIHWKAKATLHQPKSQGGLGIRRLGCFNNALLMKKVWRIFHQPHLLISKVFRGMPPMQSWIRSPKTNVSLGRTSLLRASSQLQQLCAWKVGNGLSLKAASHAWVHGKVPVFRDCISLREAYNTSVASLILPGHRGWNVGKIHQLFVPGDARQIQGLELPSNPQVLDTPYWPFSMTGIYSTKSGYCALLTHQQNHIHSMTPPPTSGFFRRLWGLSIMPKWKLFVWKLWHNCLATSSNLSYRGLTLADQCLTCLHDGEDSTHIFRECPIACEAWERSTLHMVVSHQPLLAIDLWLEFWLEKFIKEDGLQSPRVPLFIGILWAIWKTRNDQVFRNQRATLATLVAHMQDSEDQHHKFTLQGAQATSSRNLRDAIHPPGFSSVNLGGSYASGPPIVIQTDGSWDAESGHGGAGWVPFIQPTQGDYKFGVFMFASSAIHTEAAACLHALRWAGSNSLFNVVIFTDSARLVDFAEFRTTPDISIQHMLNDIWEAASSLHWCCLVKVTRSQVQQAHEIANQCRRQRLVFT